MIASSISGGQDLWRSDGTSAGTILIVDGFNAARAREFTVARNTLFYADHLTDENSGPVDPEDMYQLWQSDLTITNTQPVKDLFPATSFPQSNNLTLAQNILFFTTSNGPGVIKLWKYDPLTPATAIPFFTLVNSDTDQDRAWIMNGDTIALYPGEDINIRFNPTVNAQSVQFLLNGSVFSIENETPYALAGDNNGNYNPWTTFNEGLYTLTARAYSGNGASGTLLSTTTIQFYIKEIILPLPPLANAGTDKTITLPTTTSSLNGTASDPDGNVTSTFWAWISGPGYPDAAPVINSPNSLNTIVSGLNTPGEYRFRLIVTDNDNLMSFDDVLISVIPPPGQSVISFTLINADTDTDIMNILNGTVLDLHNFTTSNFNIRANTNPATVGSVRFQYDATFVRIENQAPYALFADINGNYNPGTLTLGNHSLTATPYSGSNASGITGTALTVNFQVVNSGARIGVQEEWPMIHCYPNPSSDNFTISINYENQGLATVEIYDHLGQLVETLYEGIAKQEFVTHWETKNHIPGIYTVQFKNGENIYIEKIVLLK